MKKILCVLPRVTGGGAECFFLTFLQCIDRSCYRAVAVLAKGGGGFDHEIPADVPVHILHGRIDSMDSAFFFGHLRYTFALKKVIKAETPDAIISFGSLFNGAVALSSLWAKFSGPVILVEAVHESSEIATHRWLAKWGRILFLRLTYPLASAIVSVSHDVASDLRDYFGIAKEKLHVIYNGVDLDKLRVLGKRPVDHPWLCHPGQGYTLVACGRLVAQKGFNVLIRAMRDTENHVKLILIGDGPERKALEQEVQKYGLQKRVYFAGYDRNPFRYMSKADLFIMPSLWEGFGIVLIEAMSMGCSVIAADCPTGPREILQNGKYGILVPPDDPLTLAAEIQRLLSDKKLIEQLGLAARARANEFSAQKSVDAYINLLSALGG